MVHIKKKKILKKNNTSQLEKPAVQMRSPSEMVVNTGAKWGCSGAGSGPFLLFIPHPVAEDFCSAYCVPGPVLALGPRSQQTMVSTLKDFGVTAGKTSSEQANQHINVRLRIAVNT